MVIFLKRLTVSKIFFSIKLLSYEKNFVYLDEVLSLESKNKIIFILYFARLIVPLFPVWDILGCASAIETSFIALGLHEHCQAKILPMNNKRSIKITSGQSAVEPRNVRHHAIFVRTGGGHLL